MESQEILFIGWIARISVLLVSLVDMMTGVCEVRNHIIVCIGFLMDQS
jgi:hypothetical protein